MTEEHKELRGVSRTLIKNIWNDIKNKKPLDKNKEKLASILRDHPELNQFWENADTISDNESISDSGINPFLHTYIHFAVEDQLSKKEPPEIVDVFNRLEQHGIPRHEIIHKLGIPFTSELFQMMKKKRPFDKEEYVKKLKKLA